MEEPKRLLVTGATGYVGHWVVQHWSRKHAGVELWTTSERPRPEGVPPERYRQVDLRDEDAVAGLVRECRPDAVIHLASLISGGALADHLDINVLGTERLYRAVADTCGSARIVQVGSAAMYGLVAPDELPIREDQPFRPVTDYAVSKAAQDHLAHAMAATSGLEIMRARFFNTLGPGQPEFLVPATFISQLKEMRDSGAANLKVGLVTTRRDFLDIRDAVSALDAILAGGESGRAYNVASGVDRSIEEVIRLLMDVAGLSADLVTDSDRLRPADVPVVRADIGRITGELGWRPEVELRQSLADMWSAEG